MGCVYCQNYQFSQTGKHSELLPEELADVMLELEGKGCHNINFVSPTHVVPMIVEALDIAYERGLNIPLVYNTGAYDSLSVIKTLEGVIDIYLPDMRYASDTMAKRYSAATDYVKNNRAIVKEMARQVGVLKMRNGIAQEGLIIRLLILPNKISGTCDTLDFIRANIGKDVFLSVMSQYYPAHRANEYPELARRISVDEYNAVTRRMKDLGLENGWVQPINCNFDDSFAGENFPPSF